MGEGKEEELVLRVDMHCEACSRKVARVLKGFQGVAEVTTDYRASKVVVKGKGADPLKVCERIRKKTGRKAEIVSLPPSQKPKPPEEVKEEEPKNEEIRKDEPRAVITVVLKVLMHCEACALDLQKRIGKIQGIESVEADVANDQVKVKGPLDPDRLVNDIYKRTGKQAMIVKSEEKKEEDKKDDEKKQETKQGDECKEEDDTTTEIKKNEHYPPKYSLEYSYPSHIFSDENPNACLIM